jgi:hypothetical protein
MKPFSLLRSIICFLVCFVMLSACASQPRPEGKPIPVMTFAHLTPLELSVSAVKTASANIVQDDVFPISPYDKLQKYVAARFVPRGTQGTLSFNIESATVTHSYEPSVGAVTGFFKVGGNDVYDMRLQVRMEHLGVTNNLLDGHAITVRRIVRISEHASIAQREERQMQGVEGLFKSFDEEVTRIVLTEMNMGY